ncbi:AI-2E family transporter [Larkinella sp. VNQ87]|uniref:AI-2E family transporter n=1 Tax=Larkinella sp. VNQ87 TaxID=3400921 RepID=UPI003C01A9C0
MKEATSYPSKATLFWFIGLTLTAFFLLAAYAAQFFFLVFGGILFAVIISALSHVVSDKTRLSYRASVALVTVSLLLLIGGAIWLLAPTVSQQATQLSQSLPQSLNRLRDRLMQTEWGNQLLEGIPQKPSKFLSSSSTKNVLSQLTGIVSSTLGALVNVLIVVITGIYLASDPETYRNGFTRLFKPDFRSRILDVLDQCYETLKNWFISRSISMIVVGIATGVGLAILGVPFAVVLGILAGILNFIPNLGPYLAVAPAMLVAFPQSSSLTLYVFALYMGIQALEGYILTPLLDKRFVSLPPALLLFGQVLLGFLVGLVGILFASPLIAVLLIVVDELYVKNSLESEDRTEPEPVRQPGARSEVVPATS